MFGRKDAFAFPAWLVMPAGQCLLSGRKENRKDSVTETSQQRPKSLFNLIGTWQHRK